jgi:hypothetical protein
MSELRYRPQVQSQSLPIGQLRLSRLRWLPMRLIRSGNDEPARVQRDRQQALFDLPVAVLTQ